MYLYFAVMYQNWWFPKFVLLLNEFEKEHFWTDSLILDHESCQINLPTQQIPGRLYLPQPFHLMEFSHLLSSQQTSAESAVRVLSWSRFYPDFPENRVRCLSAVRILSGIFEKSFFKKRCPLSVCPAGQGQDRAVRTFAVPVRRRLVRGPYFLITYF